MPVELTTLGQVHLRDEAGVELRTLLTQPKRLALLVYLASICAGGRLCRRDTLVAMFWPDSDDEHARNALRQALHFIRQSAGEVVITRGADEVGIAPDSLALDVTLLEAHMDAGRPADALAFYTGDFLDGFVVRGAPAFERWVDAERARIRKRVADAAWAAADERLHEEDTAGARRFSERAFALSSNDETAVRRYIALLSVGGDRAGALAVYQDFASRMGREYGTAPSPETRELLETLVEPLETPVPAASPRPDERRRSIALRAAGLMIVVLGALALWRAARRGGEEGDPNRMAVLPFVVSGPATLHYLEDGLPILLGTRLDGAGSLRTVNARALTIYLGDDDRQSIDANRARQVAARFGAQLYVLGHVEATGEQLRVSASLYDRSHGDKPVAHAEVSGTEGEIVRAVDQLAGKLLVARIRESGGTFADTAALTTSSLPALKAWLAGEAAITAGRYAAAMVPLREAIARDSNFAIAHFRLAVAANWAGMNSVVDEEAKRAVALSGRLSPSMRLVLQAFLDMRYGNYAHAAGALRAVLATQPSSSEAWYELGEVLFHGNPPQGRPLAEARSAFETTLRLDPHNVSAAIHLARITASQHDTLALDSLSKAALDSNPDPAQRGELLLLRALAMRDLRARSRFLALPTSLEQLDALWRSTEYTGSHRLAYEIADSLTRTSPTAEMRASLHLFLAHIAMALGAPDDASARLDSVALNAPQSAAVTRLLFATNAALGGEPRAQWIARAHAGASPLPRASMDRHVFVGANRADSVRAEAVLARARVQLALGDSAAARRIAEAPVSESPNERILQATMQLELAHDAASRAAALRNAAIVDSICGARFSGQTVFAPRGLYHLAVSRALEAEGRVADAYRRLDAVPEDFGFDVAWLPELQRRRATLLDALGRKAEATAIRRATAEGIR